MLHLFNNNILMASFTDSPQLLTNFNPYVQQLPIEAVREVGMYKQAKYDEGIQKIQTSIDNVAGLDVIREVDKGYLQSKLNDLSNNLKSVAAGDFSNYQLVNSTAGMASKIAKDKLVQNAVMSSAKYRKGVQEMETANKEGKGSPSNDWLFNTKANEWLSSQDVTSGFNEGYKPYTDYSKNALEVIKGLVKNENIKDVALEFDASGKVIGILDASTRTKVAGITPERIQQALMVGLDASDFQQMQIDGRYSYSNKPTEQFVKDLTDSYTNDKNALLKQKEVLSNSMDSTNSIEAKLKIQEQVNALDRQLNLVTNDYNKITGMISNGDSEAAKAQLFTTKWINNFAQTFSHSEISQTYETNPYVQPAQFRETQKQDWNKFIQKLNQDERFHKDNIYFKEQELSLSKAKLQLEKDASGMYGSVPVTVNQDELAPVTLGKVVGQITAQKEFIDDEKSKIMKQFNKDGDEKWIAQQQAVWKAGGTVDPLLNNYFQKTEDVATELSANVAMVKDIEREADNRVGTIDKLIPKESKSLTVTFGNGSTYTYTPKELVDFNQKSKQYRSISGPGEAPFSGPGVLFNNDKAKKELSQKEYFLYLAQRDQANPVQKTIATNLRSYIKTVNEPYKQKIKERNDFIAERVKDRVMNMQGTASGVPLANALQKTSFANALIGFADNAEKQGGIPNSPDVTHENIRAIASDLSGATFTVVEGTTYQPAMYEINAVNSKGENVKFRVTPEQKASVFGDRFDASPAILAARPYINQMIRTGANTTALDGKATTPNNAFIGRSRFPNVKYYGVSANVVDSGNGYSLRINLVDPHTKKLIVKDLAYPAGGLIDEDKIVPAMQNLSDAAIYQMVTGKSATAEDIKRLQQAAKNPQ